MKHSFILPIKPFSINAFYTGNRKFKTAAAREWILTTLHFMKDSKIQSKLEALRGYFDPLKHVYEVSFKFNYPRAKLISSKGGVSSKSMDCSNVEKCLIDVIFLPKNFDDTHNLNIDDKYVTRLVSEKKVSEDEQSYYIEIELTIKPLNL